MLRRLARRFHIGEDVLRHLTTFQRFGERFEIRAPTEMIPVGARTLARAIRTRAAPQIRPDWLWPFWLERQLDPTDPSFTPRGHLPFLTNVTHRNWTAVGSPLSAWEAVVDPAGLVTMTPDGWSVDWWICDEDSWVLPSRSHRLTQWPDAAGSCVRSGVELPGGGQAVAGVYATRVRDHEYVALEITNNTNRTLTVAFALRPYNPEGLAVVEDIKVTANSIMVDGERGVVLCDRPERVAVSTFHEGDCLHHFTKGRAHNFRPMQTHDPAGLATATVSYQLGPADTRRVLLPLPPTPAAEPDRNVSVVVREAPDAGDAAQRWQRVLDRGMHVRLPDDRLQEAVDANRTYQLVLHDPGSITPGPLTYHRFWFRDAAYQLLALDRWGFHDESADVIDTYPERQRHDGFFYSQWHEWDANGAAIMSIAEHHRFTGDLPRLTKLMPAVRKGADWIERTRHRARGRNDVKRDPGLLPPGVSAEHLGPYDVYYWDNFWCLRGLCDAAYLADVMGNVTDARRWRTAADRFRADIFASIHRATRESPRPYLPAGPNRRVDAGMIGSLVAVYPLGLLDADDPIVERTVELIRDHFTLGPAFYQAIAHTGLGTYLTLQLAFVELLADDPVAWDRLRWMLDAAMSTYTWPEAIHPQTGGGCMGDGHHGWAAADFLSFVRIMLVNDLPERRTAVLSLLPREWYGADLEILDAPVHGGKLDYRLTWRDERPTLAWNWHGMSRRLVAPALDPQWSTTESEGEMTFSPAVAAGTRSTPTSRR
ncbi:hypothetical protein HC028_26040 [Planosporangium flavigriseum]|uniref:Alpha-L-rhamnosidase six-hairpin glycosidase domain-containing protein n=1 Tax=Planosporangium flavigriseum TaxID=373681 RepID=A0A8J3PQ09_9ACTN|nr:hypothetical protein [Planosporangium flavigriseum]NJC67940.1 hypothetical protein [Planosporangium flavigriseum]GIG76473.1 hypothetical protein Pfl04_48770 [Planosporangium flavigriseum]